MDSSGQNLNIKTRKPYTITKQRERWTEGEHNSFLEALKLYGRAWQRIEEHIGTKSAVQIRSHAQKFFTKLEKEALAKGVPIRQALDMEIPPPRPKRKPNYPYPRKTGPRTNPEVAEKDGKQATLVSSLQSGKHVLDLVTKPFAETTGGDEELEDAKTSQQVENKREDLQEPPCESRAGTPCTFREVINHDDATESYITVETRKHQKLDQDGINTLFFGHENSQCSDKLSPGVQNYPRHVPVQIVDGISAKENVPFQESTLDKLGDVHQHPNLFVNMAATGPNNNNNNNNNYQTVPTFHPLFTPFSDNQEDHRSSFLHFSPTISSLIVSSLLQNPAAHAAASFAATFWHPLANTEATSGVSSSRDQLKSCEAPSMAAIAAATVAAATAWWAAHGLLPVCPPFYSGYSYMDNNQARVANNASEGVFQEEKMDVQQQSEGLTKKRAAMSSSSSEDSDGDGGGDRKANAESDIKETAPVVGLHDSSKTNVRKQIDRSSCGSNTTSSSEIEMDEKEKKESDVNVPCNDSVSRMSRCSITPNESWKEVSEEGRLAFQALFSREVLPQSFSHSATEKDQQLDLNKESNAPSSSYAVLRVGLGNVKLNIHHTGFKPYKRCSVEAKEGKAGSSQNDEKAQKRKRLEAQG